MAPRVARRPLRGDPAATLYSRMTERALLDTLDRLVSRALVHPEVRRRLAAIAERLARNPDVRIAWEPVPLEPYGQLPAGIRSAWVFALRAATSTGAERHPNSHQRVVSLSGSADLQTWDGSRWQSHRLESGSADLDGRWLSIPVGTWHRPVVDAAQDWLVMSFHTAEADRLIEEVAEDDEHPDAAPARVRVYAGRNAR
ncbi:MAG TPA: hypothetical protein VNI83_05985 [Vicinamibacterales bacterium]|nr:hypothetical protein [Vicinamibacterales bacterium]